MASTIMFTITISRNIFSLCFHFGNQWHPPSWSPRKIFSLWKLWLYNNVHYWSPSWSPKCFHFVFTFWKNYCMQIVILLLFFSRNVINSLSYPLRQPVEQSVEQWYIIFNPRISR